jgi:tetratricopeptide (TPR) repeat protein
MLVLAPQMEIKRDRAAALIEVAAFYMQAGEAERAGDAADRAVGEQVEADGLAELAVRAVEIGLHEKGIRVAESIEGDEGRGHALEQVVLALVETGQLAQADAAAQRLAADRWIRALAAVAEGYAAAGQKTQAAGALRKALEVREAQGAEVLSAVDTGELARICTAIWSGETPAELFEEAFDRTTRREWGRRDELRRTAAQVELLGRYAAAGHFNDALDRAQKIKNSLRRVQALVAIAVAYREQGKMKLGFDLLGAAIKDAWKMRPSCAKVEAIAEIAVGYSRISATDKVTGVADQALTVLKKIKDREKQLCPESADVLRGLADAGACDSIWRRIDLIDDVQNQIEKLIENGGRCIELRRSRDAIQMLIRGDELVTAHGAGDKAREWAAIARHLARAAEYDKALGVAAKISRDSGYKPAALTWILEGYLRNVGGENGGAEEQRLLARVWEQVPD